MIRIKEETFSWYLITLQIAFKTRERHQGSIEVIVFTIAEVYPVESPKTV